ncbi:hypothetical protein [Sphingomonas sp. Leaf10]|uniref:hypothetical protein n=1 Tax=Sphingomonas sp. Leaf10 TaxID=1735676 RepID=UPI000B05FBE8|nr:hypothetical protein [Sphingomonas sp. Leaf10]
MTERWMEELRNKVPTPPSDMDADAFADHLRQRAEAAKKLEHGLLTEVPMLYGSPGRHEPEGDPGIVIARLHRDELLRRSGALPFQRSEKTPARLPYERFLIAIGLVLEALYFFGRD